MNTPEIHDKVIKINTINKMNYKEMKAYKRNIISFISKELNNYTISIEIKLLEGVENKVHLDSNEKLKILIKKNKGIASLIEEFKLRI